MLQEASGSPQVWLMGTELDKDTHPPQFPQPPTRTPWSGLEPEQ